jgi:hypothetical protein
MVKGRETKNFTMGWMATACQTPNLGRVGERKSSITARERARDIVDIQANYGTQREGRARSGGGIDFNGPSVVADWKRSECASGNHGRWRRRRG